jgi:Domain of unknown function (DUF1906)
MLSAGRRSPGARLVGPPAVAATLVATLATLVLGGLLPGAATAAQASSSTKVVRYHGYELTVPAAWPVFDLSRQPRVCVRFDRHAVYLGQPSAGQRCPARAVGRSEAILVQPMRASAAAGSPRGSAVPAVASPRARSSEGTSAEFTVPAHQVIVTATWAHQPRVIERAVGVRSLGALLRRSHAIAGAAAARRRPSALTAGAVYTGLGFDVCSTPSPAAMAAWGSSPYRAVGIYLGGANMACSQSNLTAAWTEQETASGWHLILIYVGLQAPRNECGCAAISSSSASSQGAAAAADAIAHAQLLGIGSGNPIYEDMEAYPHTASNTSAVLAFLAGWTTELHSQGYLSGVYASTGSGVADLVNNYGTGYSEPDDIWIAHWNGQQATSDPSVPSSYWPSHRRVHQYEGGGNETWDGVTLNIDHDYVDGATAGATCFSQFPAGTFVQVSGSAATYRIAGGAPLFVSDWSTVGGPQPVTIITPQQFDSLCPFPVNGTFLMSSAGTVYRVAGGAPLRVTNWGLFGGVQPSVAIDQWDIDNLGNPVAHLNAVPANGTIVQGEPSHKFWTFAAGRRMYGGARSRAVAVDDAGLSPFPTVPCVVPRLRHQPLANVKKALAKADCRLGKVHRPRHWPRSHLLRVVWQIPAPGRRHAASWLVGVRLR